MAKAQKMRKPQAKSKRQSRLDSFEPKVRGNTKVSKESGKNQFTTLLHLKDVGRRVVSHLITEAIMMFCGML